MTRVRRPCIDCGALTTGTRCPRHEREHTAQRNSHADAARRIVTLWRILHGDWCPGFDREPHPSTDLTAEHSTPITKGGIPDGVLCRSCNSRKSDRIGFSASPAPTEHPASRSPVTHEQGEP